MDSGIQTDVLIKMSHVQSKTMDIGSQVLMATGPISRSMLEKWRELNSLMEKREQVMKPKIEMDHGPSSHLKKERVMEDIG
jgi:hypothetical protein